MNPALIKQHIRQNSIFALDDTPDIFTLATPYHVHDEAYGLAAFFEEGGLPPELPPAPQPMPVRWISSPVQIVAANPQEFAKQYLLEFYKHLLQTCPGNQTGLQAANRLAVGDFDGLLNGLPQPYTDDSVMLTTNPEFFQLSIADHTGLIRNGTLVRRVPPLFWNQYLFPFNEPLILTSHGPYRKIITAGRSAIVLNLPQEVTLIDRRVNLWQTTLQYAITHPDYVKVYPIA